MRKHLCGRRASSCGFDAGLAMMSISLRNGRLYHTCGQEIRKPQRLGCKILVGRTANARSSGLGGITGELRIKVDNMEPACCECNHGGTHADTLFPRRFSLRALSSAIMPRQREENE